MKGILQVGKNRDKEGFFGIDLGKAELGLILLTGMTSSGKGITHFHLYSQLMGSHSPDELGFVFLDMTQVDFGRWPSDYLYRPVVHGTDNGLQALEELAEESVARDEGTRDKRRGIVIHVEECDMVVKDRDRFEQALLKLVGRKGSNNMFVVFSSSRPSPSVFTKKILAVTDLKIVHQLASEKDWLHVTGQNLMREVNKPGEKVVFYQDKMDILRSFSEAYVRAIENWEAGDFARNARPDYMTYTGGDDTKPSPNYSTSKWWKRLGNLLKH